jgi:hypothetical protein
MGPADSCGGEGGRASVRFTGLVVYSEHGTPFGERHFHGPKWRATCPSLMIHVPYETPAEPWMAGPQQGE